MSKVLRTRAERTCEKVLMAAERLFLRHRFAGTNMDEVATLANVSKQTVYAHFKSKEALFLEVVRGMTGGAADEFRKQVADPEDNVPLDRFLLDFAGRQLAIVMTPRLMQLRRLVIAEAERFPELGRALHDNGPGRSIGRLERAFARYRDKGQMKGDDLRVAAGFFNWLVMGGPTSDAMLLGDAAIPSEDQLEAHASEAVRIFLAAYAGNEGQLQAATAERRGPHDPR